MGLQCWWEVKCRVVTAKGREGEKWGQNWCGGGAGGEGSERVVQLPPHPRREEGTFSNCFCAKEAQVGSDFRLLLSRQGNGLG